MSTREEEFLSVVNAWYGTYPVIDGMLIKEGRPDPITLDRAVEIIQRMVKKSAEADPDSVPKLDPGDA